MELRQRWEVEEVYSLLAEEVDYCFVQSLVDSATLAHQAEHLE